MRIHLSNLWLAAGLAVFASAAHAEPTDIVVRVLSKDAKFIGTSMGGMRVRCATPIRAKCLPAGQRRAAPVTPNAGCIRTEGAAHLSNCTLWVKIDCELDSVQMRSKSGRHQVRETAVVKRDLAALSR